MRYLVALIAALFIIGAAAFFVQSTQRRLWNRTLQTMKQARDRGEITQEQYQKATENRRLADFGVEVTPAEMRQLQIADLVSSFWIVLAPLLVAGCLLVAYLTRSREVAPGP